MKFRDQRKLKGLMVEKDVTQQELANLLGISRTMFNRKINGKNKFDLQEAFIIADFFKKAIEDIFLV